MIRLKDARLLRKSLNIVLRFGHLSCQSKMAIWTQGVACIWNNHAVYWGSDLEVNKTFQPWTLTFHLQGSLRGRGRAGNLSYDDTMYYTGPSPQGTWTEGKKAKSQKLSVVGLFTPANKVRFCVSRCQLTCSCDLCAYMNVSTYLLPLYMDPV